MKFELWGCRASPATPSAASGIGSAEISDYPGSVQGLGLGAAVLVPKSRVLALKPEP